MEARECGLFIAVGAKGVGKTFQSTKELSVAAKGDVSTGLQSRTVLILDANDEYQNCAAIAYDVREENDYKRAAPIRGLINRKGMYRIRPLRVDRRPMTADELQRACFDICKHFVNGVILLEDYNKYIEGKEARQLISVLVTLRHKNIDLWIHLQSAAPISTKLWQNVNYIRFHRINDNVDRIKHRIPYELMKIAQLGVNYEYQKGNKRYFCYVAVLDEKIFGMSEDTFKVACTHYLSKNKGLLNDLMNQIDFTDQTGKKYKNKQEAAQNYILELREKYFIA
jgi:hypothetical protein